MKLVDFQYIQTGVRKLAAVKETLEHMQNAYKEALAALTDGIVEQSSGVTVLYGCVNSGDGSDYDISAGAVVYDGEIYEVPSFSGTATGSNVPVLSVNTTYLDSDPALYQKANGSTETINTHAIRKLIWSFASSGSGVADLSDCVTLKQRISDLLALSNYALLAGPTFTGVPKAPTADVSTDSTQIATTAFVKAVVSALVASAPAALDTLNELAAALGDDENFATTVTNALAEKADVDDLDERSFGGRYSSIGPKFATGSDYSIDKGSSAFPEPASLGYPLTGTSFQVITTGNAQTAIQLSGDGAGDIYHRAHSGTAWGAWTKINTGG